MLLAWGSYTVVLGARRLVASRTDGDHTNDIAAVNMSFGGPPADQATMPLPAETIRAPAAVEVVVTGAPGQTVSCPAAEQRVPARASQEPVGAVVPE